jgi:hypothetical protein
MKPEQQQPPLGRNPNHIERWQTVGQPQTSSKGNPKQTLGAKQTGVWHSRVDQDALQTGVWNPSRQSEAAPAGNRWVLLAIVVVCSLSSFAIFQSLLRPASGIRTVTAVNAAPRALPPAVNLQPSEAEQVAASAVRFDAQTTTGTTKPVEITGVTKPVETGSSTIVETTPMNTLPANQIRLEQIDSIAASGGQPVLRFKDGTSLNIDDFTLRQLPSDVRLRITYSRGRDGP